MAMTELREERQSRLLWCCRPLFDRARLPLQCARHPALAGKDVIMKRESQSCYRWHTALGERFTYQKTIAFEGCVVRFDSQQNKRNFYFGL